MALALLERAGCCHHYETQSWPNFKEQQEEALVSLEKRLEELKALALRKQKEEASFGILLLLRKHLGIFLLLTSLLWAYLLVSCWIVAFCSCAVTPGAFSFSFCAVTPEVSHEVTEKKFR